MSVSVKPKQEGDSFSLRQTQSKRDSERDKYTQGHTHSECERETQIQNRETESMGEKYTQRDRVRNAQTREK